MPKVDPKLQQRIREYVDAYYAAFRGGVVHYAQLPDIFPDTFTGGKAVEAIRCTGGVVLVHRRSEIDNFSYVADSRIFGEVIRSLTATPEFVDDTGRKTRAGIGLSSPGRLDAELWDLHALVGIESDLGQQSVVDWRPNWQRLEASELLGESRWSGLTGALKGEKQVLAFVAAHLMNVQAQEQRDILDAFERTIADYRRLLKRLTREEEAQEFLTNHPILLAPEAVKITPKLQLGTEYVTDYVIEYADHRYRLVELERPDHKLFTKGGEQTAELRHGVRQVSDWLRWVSENVSYARNTLPEVIDPEGLVVIGLEAGHAARKSLAQLNRELSRISVITYDGLAERAQQFLDNLRSVR